MFEQAFVENAGRRLRPWTLAVSATGQMAAVGAFILVTLVRTEALPGGLSRSGFITVPGDPVKEVAIQRPAPARAVIPVRKTTLLLPVPALRGHGTVVVLEDDAPSLFGPGESVPGGIPGPGAGVGCFGCTATPGAPPPPAPTPEARPDKPAPIVRIRVGGAVQTAKLISQPKPVYPPLARAARISGTVRLEAVIGKDGLIQDLRLVSGHHLLAPAAREAVRQWRYEPTLLNGEPVEVLTQIEVHFTMS
ncbi:MAG: energy transducer TonB [Acidobacteria bacterium]|nr:energy transducer TonB [Acidobacteriota bacterium]